MSEPMSFADRLAAVHDFPCRYTFKLIGLSSPAMERSVREALSAVVPQVEPDIGQRASSSGKYTALTVEVLVPDVQAILDLYARFQAIEGLTHLL